MDKTMLGCVSVKDFRGPMMDLMEKVQGKDGLVWLESFKRFLRTDPLGRASVFPVWASLAGDAEGDNINLVRVPAEHLVREAKGRNIGAAVRAARECGLIFCTKDVAVQIGTITKDTVIVPIGEQIDDLPLKCIQWEKLPDGMRYQPYTCSFDTHIDGSAWLVFIKPSRY